MIVRSINDTFEIAPPLMFGRVNNRSLPEGEMHYLCVQGVNFSEQQLLDRAALVDQGAHEPEERLDLNDKRVREKVKSKVRSIHKYEVQQPDGTVREITDFDEYVNHAGPEIIRWLFRVITSLEGLSQSERRNFLPLPGSPSTSEQKEPGSGSAGSVTDASG